MYDEDARDWKPSIRPTRDKIKERFQIEIPLTMDWVFSWLMAVETYYDSSSSRFAPQRNPTSS